MTGRVKNTSRAAGPALLAEVSRLRGALSRLVHANDSGGTNEELADAFAQARAALSPDPASSGGGQVVIGCSICGQYHPGRTCALPQDGGPSPTSSTPPAPGAQDGGALLPCPFCGAQMKVREHSAFHPAPTVENRCWLATAGEHGSPYELGEYDYAAWNRRAAPAAAAEGYASDEAACERDAFTDAEQIAQLNAEVERLKRERAESAAAELTRLTAALETVTRERDALQDGVNANIELIAHLNGLVLAAEARAAGADKVVALAASFCDLYSRGAANEGIAAFEVLKAEVDAFRAAAPSERRQ